MDLVLGIDCSTTATKAIAWDRHGTAVAEGRAPLAMASPCPGAFEQDPADWWQSAVAALRDVAGQVDPGRIAGLAIANQRETVGFLDDGLTPVRPAMVWLDERGRGAIDGLVADLGAGHLLRTTGKAPDPTPAVYKLAWLRQAEPGAYAAARQIVDVQGYLNARLTGERLTSWGSADPHGLFDLAAKRYDPAILAALGLDAARLFPALRPGTLVGPLTTASADATGLRQGTPVYLGGGDGQAAGLGTATLDAERAYLNLGTAAVGGVWGPEPVTDAAFRTETSLDGEGYIYELCLRTGAILTDWLVERVFGLDPRADPSCFDRLEAEAALVAPGADGLLLLPYWSGAMPPFWDPDARGLMVGLSLFHGRGHVYRALIEGVALDTAMSLAGIERVTGRPIRTLTTIGGGARSPLWRQVVADATGRDVLVSATVEATCLGAGMLAAAGAGWYPDVAAAARAMAGAVTMTVTPDPGRHARYRQLLAIYAGLHPAVAATYRALAAFRHGETA